MASHPATIDLIAVSRLATLCTAGSCGFRLTPADVEMVRRVYEYRFLHVDHLSALTKRSYKKVHGRLLKLIRNRFLARIEFPFQKHVYVMGQEGINLLVDLGVAPRETIEARLRHHELKELFLKHQLMLVDLHCMLDLACRGTAIRLIEWREGQELWDRVSVRCEREHMTLPVCPDAYFALEDCARPAGRNRLHFFLEADRSTSTHKRFEQKLMAYQAYQQAGLHTKKFGIRTFRVVTFTLTMERARGLAELAGEVLDAEDRKYFLFASISGLFLGNPSPILSDMFLNPTEEGSDGIREGLVPQA